MRRSRRESSGGEIAMMAVITKAMGAFLIIMLLLLPSYVGTRRAADEVQDEVAKAKAKVASALAGAGAGALSEEEADKLRKQLKEAQEALDTAEKKIDDLEARIDQLENDNDRLEKEADEQRQRADELEEKQKFLVEEPLYIEVSFEQCGWLQPGEIDGMVFADSSENWVYGYYINGTKLNFLVRGVRPGDQVRLALARHGRTQNAQQSCAYTFRTYYHNDNFTTTVELPATAIVNHFATLLIQEKGYEIQDTPQQFRTEVEAINGNPDLWKAFLDPDKPLPASLTELPSDLSPAVDKAIEEKKLPQLVGDTLVGLVRWGRISPAAAQKRLADLGKPKPAAGSAGTTR